MKNFHTLLGLLIALCMVFTMLPFAATAADNQTLADRPATGDTNGDGVANNIDAMRILQHTVGLITLDADTLRTADTNGDGTVNNLDAMQVLQYAVGILEQFPVDVTPGPEPATVTIWTFPLGNMDWMDDILSLYTEMNPHVTVVWEMLDYSTGEARINEAIENGTAPDLILEGPEWLVAKLGARGVMADLSDLFDSGDRAQIPANVLAACTGADGNIYQYPLAMTVHTMAINKTVFEAAGAMEYVDEANHTWTTEDFCAAVNAVYAYTGTAVGNVYCGGIGGDQGTRALVNNLYGGTYTNPEHTRYTWDTLENLAALELLCAFGDALPFNPGIAGGDDIQMFKEGQLSMTFCWNPSMHRGTIDQDTGLALTNTGDEILYMSFPSPNGNDAQLQFGVWGFGAIDNGDEARLDAAKDLISFLCDSDDYSSDVNGLSAEIAGAIGFLPVRNGHLEIYQDYMAEFMDAALMAGDYYQITVNWANARSYWQDLLRSVAAGDDIGYTAAYWNAMVNGDELPEPPVTPSEPVEITLWTYPIGGWNREDDIQHLLSLFNDVYPNITVNVEFLTYVDGDSHVDQAIADGTTPDLILESPGRLVANWGARGVMADLSDLFDDDDREQIYENVLDACVASDGNAYMYPMIMTVHTMAINKTVFEAAGAMQYIDEETHTWTTEDFFAAINQVYAYTGTPVGRIYCGGKGGDQGTRALVNNLYGGTYTNPENTRYTWDSAENIAALDALYNLDGLVFDPNIVGGDEIQMFKDGELNMAFCWSHHQQNDATNEETGIAQTNNGDEILYMAFPSENGTDARLASGIWGFGAFDNGDEAKLEAAKTFIKFWCDNEDPVYTIEASAAAGYYPVRTFEGTGYTVEYWPYEDINEYNDLMRMVGDYYAVTPNWQNARDCWQQLLQYIAYGHDVAEAVATWTVIANDFE